MQVSKFIFTSLFMLASCINVAGKSVILFSPEDRPTTHLIAHIDAAQERIHAAVYMLTDKKIVKALVNAKNRGVDVQIVLDQISVTGRYGKGRMLHEGGVQVFAFAPGLRANNDKSVAVPDDGKWLSPPLMHNKYAIIDKILWTGSFNWTISGNSRNEENVIYTDDVEVLEVFAAHFETLKAKCTEDFAAVEKHPHTEKGKKKTENGDLSDPVNKQA